MVSIIVSCALVLIYIPPLDRPLEIAVKNHDCSAIKKFAEEWIGDSRFFNEASNAMKLENCQ